ncbi:unnamed protein product, partial [Iphiclides podalirius]
MHQASAAAKRTRYKANGALIGLAEMCICGVGQSAGTGSGSGTGSVYGVRERGGFVFLQIRCERRRLSVLAFRGQSSTASAAAPTYGKAGVPSVDRLP